MVRDLLQNRSITNQTTWIEFVTKYKDDLRYFDLVAQSYPYVPISTDNERDSNTIFGTPNCTNYSGS